MSGMTYSNYGGEGGCRVQSTMSNQMRAWKHAYDQQDGSLEDEVETSYSPKALQHPIFTTMGGAPVQITHVAGGSLEQIVGKIGGKDPSILSGYKGVEMLRNAYEHFRTTPEGKRQLESVGAKKPDGYAIVDTKGQAKALTMYANDGRILLGWDKKYMHVLQDPQRYKGEFMEIMGHEQTHIGGDLSEVSAHKRNGEHWQKEAQLTSDPYKSQIYEGIATREIQMSQAYEQGRMQNPFGGYEGPQSIGASYQAPPTMTGGPSYRSPPLGIGSIDNCA
ncbi:hypothetical protein HY641_02275 [Candidatus Woesearchaeota archaeon]|nr:hypothetical protein [Candidatus Woesearchaeota archaeon]